MPSDDDASCHDDASIVMLGCIAMRTAGCAAAGDAPAMAASSAMQRPWCAARQTPERAPRRGGEAHPSLQIMRAMSAQSRGAATSESSQTCQGNANRGPPASSNCLRVNVADTWQIISHYANR